MIDPMLSLALSVYSNPGVYAVLLGSGVSRSSRILTGWEVKLDLIRKVAHLEDEDCEPEPEIWYKAKYGEDPNYAKLLDTLAHSPAERSQLLRSYFEPTDEEREQGSKVPTPAHVAIADLVAKGYIRVILTTNFDHLMEDALKAAGVNPAVVSTVDAIKGAPPLVHTKCTVIKLHGDYLDSRIKNTPDELAHYDHAMNHELDRILDEFGLIICGWSAEWDTALRAAIARSKSRRYTTYWTSISDPLPQAERLITLRDAQALRISGADTFFPDLADKVKSLRNLNRTHPLSAKVAAETAKRYLADDRYRIRLHDLAIDETTRLNDEVSEAKLPTAGVSFSGEAFQQRIRQYEALAETMIAIMIEGCYWGTTAQADLWRECLERLADTAAAPLSRNTWTYFLLYVPALLLYAGGISALVAQHYDTLVTLLAKPIVHSRNKEEPFAQVLSDVWRYRVFNYYPGWENMRTPLSDLLYEVLREPLRKLLPSDTRYQQHFDQFEYLFSLVVAGKHEKENRREQFNISLSMNQWYPPKPFWAPVGCFGWRNTGDPESFASPQIDELLATSDLRNQLMTAWPFSDEEVSVEQAKEALDSFVAKLGWWR